MEKGLRAKKEELVESWEKCFETKFDDKFNKKGKEKFWDDETSLGEAEGMLTSAGINVILEDLGGVIGMAIVSESNVNKNKSGIKFAVLNIDASFIYRKKFESKKDAEEFIKNICLTSSYTRDDFDIFEERDDG